MRRLLPDTIAGRTLLVLLIGFAISHFASSLLYHSVREDSFSVLGGGHLADRVVAIDRLFDETASERRFKIVEAVSTPSFQVSWTQNSVASASAPQDWHTRVIREFLTASLDKIDKPGLRVQHVEPSSSGDATSPVGGIPVTGSFQETAEMHRRLASSLETLGGTMLISIPLSDGSWLNFRAPLEMPLPFWSLRFILSLVVMIVAVASLSIWAVLRLTSPLATFVRAAERLGRDVEAQPLPEVGPRETRIASRAFNNMQERLRRFVEDRTRMLAAISHDLRTPITRLRLRAEFVEDPEQQAKMLRDLDEMEAMIKATITFAQHESSHERRETIDLAAMLQSICDEFADMGHSVEFRGHARFPYPCSPLSCRRALTNVIENAVTYGKRARVELEVTADRVFIRVHDDGPGVPVDETEKVFSPLLPP